MVLLQSLFNPVVYIVAVAFEVSDVLTCAGVYDGFNCILMQIPQLIEEMP